MTNTKRVAKKNKDKSAFAHLAPFAAYVQRLERRITKLETAKK